MNIYQLEHSQDVIYNVHDPVRCAGQPCPVHSLTDHHMRAFPQRWAGVMLRECPHGSVHPDPDEPWKDPLRGHLCGCGCRCCVPVAMPDLGDLDDVDRWLRS